MTLSLVRPRWWYVLALPDFSQIKNILTGCPYAFGDAYNKGQGQVHDTCSCPYRGRARVL